MLFAVCDRRLGVLSSRTHVSVASMPSALPSSDVRWSSGAAYPQPERVLPFGQQSGTKDQRQKKRIVFTVDFKINVFFPGLASQLHAVSAVCVYIHRVRRPNTVGRQANSTVCAVGFVQIRPVQVAFVGSKDNR